MGVELDGHQRPPRVIIIWLYSAQTFGFGSTSDSLIPGRLNCTNKVSLIRRYEIRISVFKLIMRSINARQNRMLMST